MTSITLTDLTKRFDDVTAVDGIDSDVREGEFLTLVGPSGCGKTTTLRLLAGLESATAGSIAFGDREVTGREPHERNVAMVFQNYALYPHMSARRNVTFGIDSATDYSEEVVDERVEEAARMLDIADLLERKPGALSGGEKQRVAIARAIVRDPDVLLMDEPLSNLDAKLRLRTRAELAELHEEIGTTTVYVTHDQAEALTLGDRVAVMNDGHIEQLDPPQTLYDYPRTRFVAEFIGSPAMNALEVAVESTPEGYRARAEGVDVSLPATDDLAELAGEPAVLGVRPEDLDRVETGPISCTASTTESLGKSTIVHATAGGQPLVVEADARLELRPGEGFSVAPDADRLHLFDPETGRACYHSDPALERGVGPIEN